MQTFSALNTAAKSQARPIALNFAIPAQFAPGSTAGGPSVTCLNAYTARVAINPNLVIPDNSSVDLIQASYAYSVPNVAAAGQIDSIPGGNSTVGFSYSGVTYPFQVPTGLYDYLDMQAAWNQIVIAQGWVPAGKSLFTFSGIAATQQLVITVDPAAFGPSTPTSFDFSFPPIGGMGKLLGFAPGVLYPVSVSAISSTVGPNAASFSDTSAYILYLSLVTGAYINGLAGQMIRAFPLGASQPNSVTAFQSTMRYPVPAASGVCSYVDIWVTDQSGNRIPLVWFQSPWEFSVLVTKNKADGSI